MVATFAVGAVGVASAGEGSDFPLQNLPFGVVAPRARGAPRGVVRIGDEVLDLSGLAIAGLLEDEALAAAKAAGEGSLNALFALAEPL